MNCIIMKTTAQIVKVNGANMGPPGSCRPQMGPMLAPWTLLSGRVIQPNIHTWIAWMLLGIASNWDYYCLLNWFTVFLYLYFTISWWFRFNFNDVFWVEFIENYSNCLYIPIFIHHKLSSQKRRYAETKLFPRQPTNHRASRPIYIFISFIAILSYIRYVDFNFYNVRESACYHCHSLIYNISVIHYTICGAVYFLFTHFLCDGWDNIYILCLIINIRSEVWTITHCLGLGHETMVCAVCLSILLSKSKHTSFVLLKTHTIS